MLNITASNTKMVTIRLIVSLLYGNDHAHGISTPGNLYWRWTESVKRRFDAYLLYAEANILPYFCSVMKCGCGVWRLPRSNPKSSQPLASSICYTSWSLLAKLSIKLTLFCSALAASMWWVAQTNTDIIQSQDASEKRSSFNPNHLQESHPSNTGSRFDLINHLDLREKSQE